MHPPRRFRISRHQPRYRACRSKSKPPWNAPVRRPGGAAASRRFAAIPLPGPGGKIGDGFSALRALPAEPSRCSDALFAELHHRDGRPYVQSDREAQRFESQPRPGRDRRRIATSNSSSTGSTVVLTSDTTPAGIVTLSGILTGSATAQ